MQGVCARWTACAAAAAAAGIAHGGRRTMAHPGWGRQWWPAIRTSNGHLGAPLRCTLSSSCHRIVLATAPGVPTPQHRFPDPQKLAAGFQLAFSRTGPKTVSCSPLLVSRFGGEHNVLSLHTRSPVMSGLHLSTCGRDERIQDFQKQLKESKTSKSNCRLYCSYRTPIES